MTVPSGRNTVKAEVLSIAVTSEFRKVKLSGSGIKGVRSDSTLESIRKAVKFPFTSSVVMVSTFPSPNVKTPPVVVNVSVSTPSKWSIISLKISSLRYSLGILEHFP